MRYVSFKTKKNEIAVGERLGFQIRSSNGELKAVVGEIVNLGVTKCGRYSYLEADIGERLTRKFVVC